MCSPLHKLCVGTRIDGTLLSYVLIHIRSVASHSMRILVPLQLVCRYPRRGPLCHLGRSDLLGMCPVVPDTVSPTMDVVAMHFFFACLTYNSLWLALSARGSSIRTGVYPMCASVYPLCTRVRPLCASVHSPYMRVHPLCMRASPLCVGVHLVHAGVILVLACVCSICAGVCPTCSGVRPVCAGVHPICQVVCPVYTGVYSDCGEGRH